MDTWQVIAILASIAWGSYIVEKRIQSLEDQLTSLRVDLKRLLEEVLP